jgi:ankyrin repeat protein
MIFDTTLHDEKSKLERIFTLEDSMCPFHAEGIYELITPDHSLVVNVDQHGLHLFDSNHGFFNNSKEISELLFRFYKKNKTEQLFLGINCFKPKDKKGMDQSLTESETAIQEKLKVGYNNWMDSIPKEQQDGLTGDILFFAIVKHQLPIIKKLLSSELTNNTALFNLDKSQGEPPLMVACRYGHLEIVQELLNPLYSKLIDLKQQKDKFNKTALMVACEHGHLEVVQELLKLTGIRQIDLNEKDDFDNYTGLILACKNGHLEIVQELLKSDKIEVEETALNIALENNHAAIAQLIENRLKEEKSLSNKVNSIEVDIQSFKVDPLKHHVKEEKPISNITFFLSLFSQPQTVKSDHFQKTPDEEIIHSTGIKKDLK